MKSNVSDASRKDAAGTVVAVPVLTLRKLLASAILWSETSGHRPHIGGVLLEADGELLRLVSTNGCGLFCAEVKAKSEPFAFNLSQEDAADVLAMLKRKPRYSANDNGVPEATLAVAGKNCRVEYGSMRIAALHGADGFPPWRKVVDEKRGEKSPVVGLGTKFLLKAAKSFDSNDVKVEANGALEPVMFRGHVAECPAFVLLMPTRLG